MSRQPIGHTCPEIDKYIKWIKAAIVKDRDLKRMNEGELLDAATSMSSELESCIEYLENIRASNDKLRQWGEEEAERVDELEKEIEELQNQTTES